MIHRESFITLKEISSEGKFNKTFYWNLFQDLNIFADVAHRSRHDVNKSIIEELASATRT